MLLLLLMFILLQVAVHANTSVRQCKSLGQLLSLLGASLGGRACPAALGALGCLYGEFGDLLTAKKSGEKKQTELAEQLAAVMPHASSCSCCSLIASRKSQLFILEGANR